LFCQSQIYLDDCCKTLFLIVCGNFHIHLWFSCYRDLGLPIYDCGISPSCQHKYSEHNLQTPLPFHYLERPAKYRMQNNQQTKQTYINMFQHLVQSCSQSLSGVHLDISVLHLDFEIAVHEGSAFPLVNISIQNIICKLHCLFIIWSVLQNIECKTISNISGL
jgi:hypothetical protein